jgi:tetratricopeptide (TPR) repeat protein
MSWFAFGAAPQPVPSDRARAEELARSGHSAEALGLFEDIAGQNPGDIEARLWAARLKLRIGRTNEAEADFRSVIGEHPNDVDARIGLGATLTRQGQWAEAQMILQEVEREAPENADLLAALARAYRRGSDDRRALEYFARAKALAPNDPDLIEGYESALRSHGHQVQFEGFGEQGVGGVNTGSGELRVLLRTVPRLHVEGSARVQQRAGAPDVLGGGGVLWRTHGATTVGIRAIGGPGNTVLPTSDLSGDVVHYKSTFEVGGMVRRMTFADASVVAASPLLAWDPGGRWRLDTRYTLSGVSFMATGETSADHSVLVRETFRVWRRVAIQTSYAYGIESFEDLTADRLSSLDATTLAAGIRISVPSHTLLNATWEHQWRSNDTTIDRITVSLTQFLP